MKKKEEEIPIVIRDNEDLRNILIQVNLKKSATSVLSSFSAWGNLALIMEALGVTAEECIKEGIKRKKVKEAIKNYLAKVLSSYQVV